MNLLSMDTVAKYKQIHAHLLEAESVFITAHPRCGDALGSTLSMALWLDSVGVSYTIFSAEDVPEEFMYLPKAHEVVCDPSAVHLSEFDTLLVLDSGDLRHARIHDKVANEVRGSQTTMVNIDHHITNSLYGDIAVVNTAAPSTTCMLYDFFVANNIAITKEIATCLLTGILYDTGIFTNGATNQNALATSAKLLSSGLPLNTVVDALAKNKTIDLLRLWGQVLSRLEHNEKFHIVHTGMMLADFEQFGTLAGAGELANFLNNLSEGYDHEGVR